ncbi:MAG: hypothetical protein C0606_05950 [Hyphomicrobiales bacterium]|nr:MAG: hypothetical protein C0606_05950 [Hyphomicrobiales bacterium]
MEEMKLAATKVQRGASAVETSVVDGIQPDLRELRLKVSELDEKIDVRLKHINLSLVGLLAIDIVTLLAVLWNFGA